MKKCGRCGAEIKDYKCSLMSLTPQYPHSVWDNRCMLLCEKCSAGLVQWLASGDTIQARINQEEAQYKWFWKLKKHLLNLAKFAEGLREKHKKVLAGNSKAMFAEAVKLDKELKEYGNED